MGKLLLLIAIVVAIVWYMRRALRPAQRHESAQRRQGGQAEPQASQELVRCARCSLLLPRGEARMAGGVIFCSEEHARLGAGGGSGSG